MQNVTRFQTTLKFGGEYLRKDEDIRYRTSTFCTTISLVLGRNVW